MQYCHIIQEEIKQIVFQRARSEPALFLIISSERFVSSISSDSVIG